MKQSYWPGLAHVSIPEPATVTEEKDALLKAMCYMLLSWL